MKFNLDNYKGKYVMHCKTQKEARIFCDYLHERGRRWLSGDSYENETYWSKYKKNTVYFFNEGAFGDITDSDLVPYTILEWSDFMNNTFTKADLKTGDVILRRNGDVEIVNGELKMFIRKNGFTDFDGINNDLTAAYGKNGWDIISVRRPADRSDCQFDAFVENRGTLVYDRERDEVEELTLAEVCKLLGKNIKIIP